MFYSASALFAMQTAVIAMGCLSVMFRCFVQMNEDTTVSEYSQGITLSECVKVKHPLPLAII